MTESIDNIAAWKQKYVSLADELEVSSQRWKSNEKQLCRVIIRLTLATGGLDSNIDPHLIEIRELLKKGVVDQSLHEKLDEVTDTLIRTGKAGATAHPVQSDYSKLFEFLDYCVEDSTLRDELSLLRERSVCGEFSESEKVFDALRKTMGVAAWEQNSSDRGFFERLIRRPDRKTARDEIGSELIRNAMFDFLSELDVPSEFDEAFSDLKADIRQQKDAERFKSTVAEIVQLLDRARNRVEDGQKKLEGFLSQLTEDLGKLGSQAIDAGSVQKANMSEQHSHQASMADHFDNLRETSLQATDLNQLQELIRNRLEVITDKIATYNKIEAAKQAESEKKLADLTHCVEKMELEASDLRSKLRMARNKALRDQLTDLPNRLAYEERLEQEVPRIKRFKSPLSLLIWDVDHFKSINDRFGHAAGDKVLKTMGSSLASGLRQTDFVCRYGGEEFVMLLPGADKEAALKVANILRLKIENCKFNSKGRPINITISCGISEFGDGDSPDAVFERADTALYKAKNLGRNQCVVG